MKKQIKISFTVNDEQYKDYEHILDDFLNNLEEVFIYNAEVREYDVED